VVTCHCIECAEKERETGELAVFAPVAFEKHGGLAAARKWKSSIRVELRVRRGGGAGLEELGLFEEAQGRGPLQWARGLEEDGV
jgi:hypothetical protein